MPGKWYCVYTYSKAEDEADHHLREQGFETFLPLYRDSRRLIVPLFPRYLFIHFDVRTQQWRRIVSTRCVRRILSVDPENPIAIRPSIIDAVRVQCQYMLEAGEPRDDIQPGVKLQFRSGGMIDLTGICKWKTADRVGVLMQLFGRDVEVVCDPRDVRVITEGQQQ